LGGEEGVVTTYFQDVSLLGLIIIFNNLFYNIYEERIQLQPHRLQGRKEKYLCTNVIQLAVMASHQNGRDTHIRQIKIYAPRENVSPMVLPEFGEFTSDVFKMFEHIR
jgi:hypothetical protein